MLPKQTLLCTLLCFAMIGQGCASFKTLAMVSKQAPAEVSQLTIVPVEGRPQSLLLRIQWLGDDAFTHLVLYRVIPDQAPLPLHTLQNSPQVVEHLRDGVVISDTTIQPGPVTYAAVLMHNDRTVDFAEVGLTWTPTPSPPSVSFSLVNHRVLLQWASHEHYGAVVFRRDLLTEDGLVRIADLQPSHHGYFLDSNVDAEGVYAYRVALMETSVIHGGSQAFPRFGSPSDELYVTVDEGSAGAPATAPESLEETP